MIQAAWPISIKKVKRGKDDTRFVYPDGSDLGPFEVQMRVCGACTIHRVFHFKTTRLVTSLFT